MRILFFGTPYFAEAVLKKLMSKHEVVNGGGKGKHSRLSI